jgi:Protein of unknown function (DUF3592)
MLSDRIGQRWIFRPTAGLLGGEKHEDVTAIAVCTAFLLMGLLMSSAGIWVALQAHLTGLWPTTTGSVVRVTLDENRTLTGVKWYPRVTYTYQAYGHTITATRISLGDPVELTDEAEARKYLERYSPHSKVTVYFSEEDATESVLEQRAPAHSFVTIGFGIAISFVGFALFLVFDLFRS